jgi:hypothetical protein
MEDGTVKSRKDIMKKNISFKKSTPQQAYQ